MFDRLAMPKNIAVQRSNISLISKFQLFDKQCLIVWSESNTKVPRVIKVGFYVILSVYT